MEQFSKTSDMGLFDLLIKRGYVYQSTNFDKISTILKSRKPITFYMGIDPTADSLHIGHFFALMMFRYFQEFGHKGILVIGGATAMIGDPSSRTDMRIMLNQEQVNHNINEVRKIAKKFILDGDKPGTIVNNADWFNNQLYIDFMRNVGSKFNVNTMLKSDAYSKRIEAGGLTFMEMGYMLMQAYDFKHLYEVEKCILQIGGSDQWGNIVAGTTLIRKTSEKEVLGLTCPLLLSKNGEKMGKTANGALWVASDKTSVFDFYQYFYNVEDQDVEMLLKLFTRISLEDIEVLLKDILQAKKIMAFEITKLIHGENEALQALEKANIMFSVNKKIKFIDNEALLMDDFIEENVVDFIYSTSLIGSKSEIRRLISAGGIKINGNAISSDEEIIKTEELDNGELILQKGKKNVYFVKIVNKERLTE